MTKILRKKAPPHIVIPDTNILWCKDKNPPVSPDFDKWWSEQSSLVSMDLIIPYIVRGELLFQQITSAFKAYERISECCEEITKITTNLHKNHLSKEKIKRQIEAKFDKWITTNFVKIAPIPVESIDLNVIAEHAIWRIPPFEADPKNPDHEKGFRDALILETVRDISAKETRSLNIAFLSADFLLRTAVSECLKTDNRIMCYESLQEFSSYLKLMQEKLTKEFIRDIIPKASLKFYSIEDENCIVLREKLRERIYEKYRPKFDNPEESESSKLQTIWSGYVASWTPNDAGLWYLAGTDFLKLEGKREFQWRSGLTFVRFFSKLSLNPISAGAATANTERILILPFKVLWKANVKTDGRFHDTTVFDIILEGNAFREPTDEDNSKYRGKIEEK